MSIGVRNLKNLILYGEVLTFVRYINFPHKRHMHNVSSFKTTINIIYIHV